MEAGVTHGGSRKNLLGDNPEEKLIELYSNEKQVTKDTPPMCFVHASNDPVSSENSVLLYAALKKANVPAEMHLYADGGHGFGMRKGQHPVATWPDRVAEWMTARGYLRAGAK